MTVGLAACGGSSLEERGGAAGSGEPSGAAGGGTVVVGSAGFTESQILAELYAQVLADAGYRTSIRTVENRELYQPSLEKGEIDVVPEYAATLAEFLNAKVNGPKAPQEKPVASSDVTATVAALKKLAEPRGLKVLPAGRAVDQNAFAVSREFAARNKLRTLSDLGRSKVKVKIAAGDECTVRPFCAPGLESRYGIDVTGVDPKGVGTPQAKQAVKDGVDQLVLTTTTDATLDAFGLVILEDDKKLQNADNVLPVVNARDAGSPEIAAALGKITKTLTTADLVELNRKVDAERAKPVDVAKEYLGEKGLLRR
ncbi:MULTISPECIES: ABC transporter substrate-binding protein [Streptomyces]|uniref:Amino acid ABC transporter substrate-binding protein n=2 Tax=Streptomyces TaxID=1883 RepID=A0A100Y5A1_9ACTN|nr:MULTISPECIES: ABC transporter substrate-binding protein [Streptomyces]KUH37907.1 amino acid ABC transporter substrate-binding protein [Streptomyces kanasensis]UUS34866.1 ABC transporter substrate-binding protein [Streptomyces changanensis]